MLSFGSFLNLNFLRAICFEMLYLCTSWSNQQAVCTNVPKKVTCKQKYYFFPKNVREDIFSGKIIYRKRCCTSGTGKRLKQKG